MNSKRIFSKSIIVLALLFPLFYFSAINTDAKKVSPEKEQTVLINKISNKTYSFMDKIKENVIPAIKDYKPETSDGKDAKQGLLDGLNSSTDKKQFKKEFKKQFKITMKKGMSQTGITSVKAQNKQLKQSLKSFDEMKSSDLNKVDQQLNRFVLLFLQVIDGKTTIQLPAIK
ncbi:hypothetical protein GSH19_07085 [Lactobacillus sp. S2-2]|uniref:hypothetical protein n=1 Tax=Lactobacillus sp. S2-2 TaxID=2692917 RepID=UPI001F2F18D9|nr:hypothetical protein [Lactobacillus sp. S2-2]MCF6515907.1 hypothetical protein [Lactobacillus sp. S2-2]